VLAFPRGERLAVVGGDDGVWVVVSAGFKFDVVYANNRVFVVLVVGNWLFTL
jgi:DNA integrity scanning protein DisA with diadenylate cyclase activity